MTFPLYFQKWISPSNHFKIKQEGSTRVTKTLAAWQRCCVEILAVWWILRKFSQKFMLFCRKIPSKCCAVFMEKFPKKYSVLFLKKFTKTAATLLEISKKGAFLVNFHQKIPLWQISTKKVAFMENFQKTLLG